jgi:integrase
VVAELKAQTVQTGPDAEAWRAALAAGDGSEDDPTPMAFSDTLDHMPEAEAAALAQQVYQTPLDHHLSAFLASRGELKADTRRRQEVTVKDLGAWLKSNHLPSTIEAIDRRTAIRYVDQLPPGRPDPQRLSLYWGWMVRREMAPSDPWDSLQATQRRPVEPERAFTDSEATLLLQGDCSPSLRLLMMVAALTGARLDAIIRMEVKGDTIILPPPKKERGPRTIPLHSHLREPLADFGAKPMGSGWQWTNSSTASSFFGLYRRKVLGPDPGGRRRAVVNFHSWRRWFISKAEQAGQPENVIAAVVGHRRPGLTFGRYSSGPGVELMRACVEAVRLPSLSEA